MKYDHTVRFIKRTFGFPAARFYEKLHRLAPLDWSRVHDELWRLCSVMNRSPVAGQYVGPTPFEPLPQFISSPLGIVPNRKPNREPNTFRLIHSLSLLEFGSVNSAIPQSSFFAQYESIQDAIAIIHYFDPGCLLA